MRGLAPRGAEAVAMATGRTVRAVQRQASKQWISLALPRDGKRRGRPQRPAPPAPAAPLPTGDLCPACAGDVITEESGLCRACHATMLAERHEREADRMRREREVRIGEAERRLDAGRQQKHRAGSKI